MAVLSSFMNSYKNFMETHSAPMTRDWFLVGSPMTLIMILVTYLYFCKSLGPRFMRDKKPYDLKNTILVYNLVQVLASIYIVAKGVKYWVLGEYNYSCEPVGENLEVASVVWMYYMCKITELLDTVFFVLRKKYNQASYLHVYHHTLMPVCAWIGATFLPGGHGTLLGFINSFIHIIMYAYYLLSSLGPEVQKYLWWKSHLTKMQLIQFGIIFVHNVQVMFRECDYPKFINFLLFSQSAYFIYLFGNFYYKSYVGARNSKVEKASENGVKNGHANGKVTTLCFPSLTANGTANGKLKAT